MNSGWAIIKTLEKIPRIEGVYTTTRFFLSCLVFLGIKCKDLFYALEIIMRGIVKRKKNIS